MKTMSVRGLARAGLLAAAVAASAAPVTFLDEHFRSAPHLMEFVAHRLYDGRVHVATRSPRTDSIDCIDLVRVDGARDDRQAELVGQHRDEAPHRCRTVAIEP